MSILDSVYCVSPLTTFLVLTHCLHDCVASFNYSNSGVCRPYLLIIQSNCQIASPSMIWKQGLLYVHAAFVCFVDVVSSYGGNVFFFCFFFLFLRDIHTIFISTVEFRYDVVIIILVNFKKTLSDKGWKQLRLISFQGVFGLEAGLLISVLNFNGEFFSFWMCRWTEMHCGVAKLEVSC